MITVFNRKELCITHNLQQQGQIRQTLAAAGIPYKIVTNSISGLRSRRGGTLGMNTDFLYQYKIYVHKRNYSRALNLINKAYAQKAAQMGPTLK